MSIIAKVADLVRSMTSNKANTDVPSGTSVPEPDDGAVRQPDREPMAGFEPERES